MDRGFRIDPRTMQPAHGRLASSSAIRSYSAAAPSSDLTKTLRQAARAHASSFSVGSRTARPRTTIAARSLRAASVSKTAKAGASAIAVAGIGRSPEASVVCVLHAQSFDPVNLVIQQVFSNFLPIKPQERRPSRSIHLIEAPMIQTELPLLCRLDAPRVVAPAEIAACKTYRDAVRLCWDKRLVRNMTKRTLAERAGLYPPHVTCYLTDNARSRDLPGWAVKGFELACDNTAITQWHALNAKLTCLEEMQWRGAAA